jgi:predicted HTH transcriptional regulator
MTETQFLDDLISYSYETEWFDFKENWYDPNGIGEYISAISNSSAVAGRAFGYLIWGINDKAHEPVGTDIDFDRDVKNEPLKHFLARQLSPSVNFSFESVQYKGKRIVILKIPAASKVPTSWNHERFIRIGSSKENLMKYPERESELWSVLKNGVPTIVNTSAGPYCQSPEFGKLFVYYAAKGIFLKKSNFEASLHFRTEEGRYNILSRLLSDDSQIPVRVAVFNGTKKSDPMFSVKEFGNTCLLYTLDAILNYCSALNVIQADERNRVVERKDVPFFDEGAFKEALVNAFLHNKWTDLNAPMVTIFNDRIEILSHGPIDPKQTKEGFFKGHSEPVNESLAKVFLQLHISEQTGRGVPKVVEVYGREAYSFSEDSILATIPFNRIGVVDYQVSEAISKKPEDNAGAERPGQPNASLNKTQKAIILIIRDDSGVTIESIARKLSLTERAIKKNINTLKKEGFLKRVGDNRSGYWEVLQ